VAATSCLKRITEQINKMTVLLLLHVYYLYRKNYCIMRENNILESILRKAVLGNKLRFSIILN